MNPSPHEMHLATAEQGKQYALKGKQKEALQLYREAMRMAVSIKAPEIFFRHYTQCVLESLELLNSYDEIIKFCEDADTHYEKLDLNNSSLHRRDHGSILERLGLVLLKKGDVAKGTITLKKAISLSGENTLPVTEEILKWLSRGLTVNASQITQSQRRHKYYVVRADQIDKKLVRKFKEGKHANVSGDINNTLQV